MVAPKDNNFYSMVTVRYGVECTVMMKSWVGKIKIVNCNQQLRFLLQCRRHEVLPPHIENMRIDIGFSNFHVKHKFLILKSRMKRNILNFKIRDINFALRSLKSELMYIEDRLLTKLPVDLVVEFFNFSKSKISRHNYHVKTKLSKKYDLLINRQNTPYSSFLNFDHKKWIVNISGKDIPDNVLHFLSLGDKFDLPLDQSVERDRRLFNLEVIKNFESNCYKVDQKILQDTRNRIAWSLNRFTRNTCHLKFIDRHILKEFYKCKKFLSDNNDVFVTRADKRQVTVVISKQEYIGQITELLNDQTTYKELKRNPLKRIATRLNNLVKSWRDNDIISEATYNLLNCTSGNTPRCYGLPKIHKQGNPLRIIVSTIGSPLYGVVTFLHDILKRKIPQPKSYVKDSWSFVSLITGKEIKSNEVMIRGLVG
ncbi:uncharacterized protein LOC113562963 [Ooceraea biroi]|uniref:uncharacterized protein LOC113562963 n=1 Tax=Ooceraea biroi TaxID=2015173 RepID=UPI000F08AF3B|nr:uncharacterized protein LOC113562963 [Ooceraea biroi]